MVLNFINPLLENSWVSWTKEKAKQLGTNPWVSWSTDKVKQVGSNTLSLINTYAVKPVIHFVIGDLMDYGGGLNWNTDKSFGIHRFGLIGSVARWKPSSDIEMAQMLDQLDKQ